MLTAQLKRKGLNYAKLVGKLADIAVMDSEPNIRNKLSWGKLQRCSSTNVWKRLDQFSKIIGLASASFLTICLFYAGGFYAGNVSGIYEGQADRVAHQYPSDTQRIVDECFTLPSRSATSQCVAEAYEASHENQRAEYDLKAQRDMSDWAWWVMVVGVLQFIATIATLGFIKLTLDATLEAVKDTSKATEAMREANSISREIGEAQTRCYLSIEEAWLDSTSSHVLVVKLVVKNSGQSPAINFHWSVEFSVQTLSISEGRLASSSSRSVGGAPAESTLWGGPSIVAGGTIDTGFCSFQSEGRLTDDEIAVLYDAASDLSVAIRVHLVATDVFGKQFSERHDFSTPFLKVGGPPPRKLTKYCQD